MKFLPFPLAVSLLLGITVLMGILASGCASFSSLNNPQPEVDTPDSTQLFMEALLTATYAVTDPSASLSAAGTQTPTDSPTATPEPSWTATATAKPTETSGPPPPQPEIFTSDRLRGGTLPQAYIEDTCLYLKARWDPNNSPPGAVVMPIMFHGITEDTQVLSDRMDVHHEDMAAFVERAHELGFETITTQELVNFLEYNAPVPPLSLLIILDDRRPGGVREHFMPYLQQYDWTLTLAWLIGDTDTRPASYLACCPNEGFLSLWEQMEAYNATGYLDIQSHGNIHNINITEYSTDEYILSELNESRRVIQEHFYCKDPATGEPVEGCQIEQPLAFIWPGGGFTPRAAQLARENGYRVGFTTNPRGPVMFNWVPQAEVFDASTPAWLPEGPVGDPLMTLPRYWSYDAVYRIDDVVRIAQQARESAGAARTSELDYYRYHCEKDYGEIPLPQEASGESE